jgi:hypothetical protein
MRAAHTARPPASDRRPNLAALDPGAIRASRGLWCGRRGAVLWSLGGVSAALANAGDVPAVLPMAVGAGMLLGYALLLLGLGALRAKRRDIT